MNAGWFLNYHEIPELLENWLAGLGVRDAERGARDLVDLTRRAGPGRLDRIAVFDGTERLVGKMVRVAVEDASAVTLFGRVETTERVATPA